MAPKNCTRPIDTMLPPVAYRSGVFWIFWGNVICECHVKFRWSRHPNQLVVPHLHLASRRDRSHLFFVSIYNVLQIWFWATFYPSFNIIWWSNASLKHNYPLEDHHLITMVFDFIKSLKLYYFRTVHSLLYLSNLLNLILWNYFFLGFFFLRKLYSTNSKLCSTVSIW